VKGVFTRLARGEEVARRKGTAIKNERNGISRGRKSVWKGEHINAPREAQGSEIPCRRKNGKQKEKGNWDKRGIKSARKGDPGREPV